MAAEKRSEVDNAPDDVDKVNPAVAGIIDPAIGWFDKPSYQGLDHDIVSDAITVPSGRFSETTSPVLFQTDELRPQKRTVVVFAPLCRNEQSRSQSRHEHE